MSPVTPDIEHVVQDGAAAHHLVVAMVIQVIMLEMVVIVVAILRGMEMLMDLLLSD